MNILLINPGRKDYIVKYFLNLLKKYKAKLFLIDPDKNIPAFQVSKLTKNFICPKANNSKKFFSYLKKFISKNKIDIIFPTSDRELKILASKKLFLYEKGVNVVISNFEVIKNCQNKIRCSKFLKKYNILYPKIISKKNIKSNLPVIKKEINGSASKNQEIIFEPGQISKNYKKKFFFQKFLKYKEYNLDILNDFNGNYLHSCAKKKISIRSGDTDKAEIVKNKIFENFAKKISNTLRHTGIIDVDFLFNKNKIYLLDINPRLGGGYPFTHAYGFDYIDCLLSLIIKKKKIKFKVLNMKEKIFSKGITIYQHTKF